MKLKALFLLLIIAACEQSTSEQTSGIRQNDADAIINKAIENAGGQSFNRSTIRFKFRDHYYDRFRNEGVFIYKRIKKDSAEVVEDVLDNEGFRRSVNTKEIAVHDTVAIKYSNSINSVIYFALLPYRLNDPAVNKEYLGKVEIENSLYHKIRVTFDAEGGGDDYEDIFLYWINKETGNVDYLAYEYHTEGGGIRFRKAVNPRIINGIRFVDYINFKPENKEVDLLQMDSLYTANQLDTLSRIVLEEVEVELGE